MCRRITWNETGYNRPVTGAFRHPHFVSLLLLCFLGLGMQSSTQHAARYDETFNIVSGVALWETGLRPIRQPNPAFVLKWISAPLLVVSGIAPFDPVAYGKEPRSYAYRYIYQNTIPADTLLTLSRLASLLLGLFLGILIWKWACQMMDTTAGLFSLGLYVFSPTLLGHAPMAGADMGGALFSTATLYFLWRLERNPRRAFAFCTGFLLGIALASKYTNLLLCPLVAVCLLRQRLRSELILLLVGSAFLGLFLGCWPVRLTEWAQTGFHVSRHLNSGHTSFLMGSISHQGWWHYFPIAFLIKTPIPVLLLTVGGGWIAWKKRTAPWQEALFFLMLPSGLWMLLGIFSKTQVGIRHLLPLYPLLCLWGGLTASSVWNEGRTRGKALLFFLGM
jgi:hypothetical protein